MTAVVIADPWNARYAHHQIQRRKAGAMGDDSKAQRLRDERAELERRVRAGEWLKIGPAAKLLEVGRTTVHRMLDNEKIGYRWTPNRTQRECDPADVIRLLDERRERQVGKSTPPPSE